MTKAELIARLEAATADDAGLMQEAWLAIYGPEPASGYGPRSDPPFCPKWEAYIKARCRFRNLLQAEAYESAALTLVLSGKGREPWWMLKAAWRGIAKAEIWVDGKGKPFRGEAATPTLAIVIAALKAGDA